MIKYLLLLLCNLLAATAAAQQLYGVVKDVATGERLQAVFVENRTSGAVTNTDTSGAYTIAIKRGDALYFHLTGYTPVMFAVVDDTRQQYRNVMMQQLVISIDTVTISGLSQYQHDSLARRTIYGKKLDERPEKFKMAKRHPLYGRAGEGTFRMDAPVSSLLRKRTRKYKRLKAFQDRYKAGETQLFIDSRYTPALVQELTGMSDDSARLFMNTYAIPYDFARAATEMELNMWVKFNYRMWIKKEKTEPGKK